MIDSIETNDDSIEWYTAKEAAEFLGITLAGINNRIFKGKIQIKKIDGKRLIAREELERVKAGSVPVRQRMPQEAEILSGIINTVLLQAEDKTKIVALEEVTTQIRIWNVSVAHGEECATYQVIFDGKQYSIIS